MAERRIDVLAYSLAEAAKAVCISEVYLRREIRAGRLACRYTGRSVLIPLDELKSWLDSVPRDARLDQARALSVPSGLMRE